METRYPLMDAMAYAVKCAGAILVFAAALSAQPPVKVDVHCAQSDIEEAGLSCSSSDPCPVYLELSAVASTGVRLVVIGNLHTEAVTLSSIVLVSEDGGTTWTEPAPRIPFASLDQIQFLGLANGWIGGQVLFPTPRDVFMLVSGDGGKNWERRAVAESGHEGALSEFWFTSKDSGKLVVDRGVAGSGGRYELYVSMTGGEGWEINQTSTTPLHVKPAAAGGPEWRLRPDAASQSYQLDRQTASGWRSIAAFPVQPGVCKPEAPVP